MEYYILNVSHPLRFLHAGKSQMDDTWMHYERQVNEHILFMILNGELYLRVDDTDYVFRPGDVFFMRAGAHHIGYRAAAVTFYWMHLDNEGVTAITPSQAMAFEQENSIPENILIPTHFRLQHHENFLISLNQLIHYYGSTPKSLYNDYLATAIMIELSTQAKMVPREEPLTSRRFEEIRSYIIGNYREPLRTCDIAQKFGYNSTYLARLFRVHLNTSVKRFIIETRLKAAETLLLSTNDPISVVAKNSGFNNEYYFMRVFKQKNGISPTQYRNTYHTQVLSKYR